MARALVPALAVAIAAWFAEFGLVAVSILSVGVVLGRWRFGRIGLVLASPLVLLVRFGLEDGWIAAGVVLCLWIPGLERPSDTSTVVAVAGLGAYLGPPDTETTFVVAGLASMLAGLSRGWEGSSAITRPEVALALGTVVAGASVEASVGRPQAVYGVFATFAPAVALTLIWMVDRGFRRGRPRPLVLDQTAVDGVLFVAGLLVTMLLGARVFGRAGPSAATGFLAAAVVAWTAIVVIAGRRVVDTPQGFDR